MLNTLVLLKWFEMTEVARISGTASSTPNERDAFAAACAEHFAVNATADCSAFYNASILSQSSILQMRYCKAYDTSLKNTYMPTNNWMRDDRLGGLEQLQNLSYGTGPVFTSVFGGFGEFDHAVDVFSFSSRRHVTRLASYHRYLVKKNTLADAIAEKEEAIRTSESVEAEAKNAALSLRSYVDGCQEPECGTE